MSTITFRHHYPYTLDDLRSELQKAKLKLGTDEVNLAYTQSYLDDATPVCLGLGITNKCNLRCSMCYYHEKEGSQEPEITTEINLELLSKVLPLIPNLQQVMLGLEGEPLLYSRLNELLTLLNQYTTNTVLVTNGNAVTPHVLGILKQHKLESVTVSLEAAEPELYASLRVKGQLNRLYEGVKNLKSCTKFINFHVVVSQANLHHLKPIVSLAKELEVNSITLDQLHMCNNAFENGLRLPEENALIEQTCDMVHFAEEQDVQIFIGPNYAKPALMDILKHQVGSHIPAFKYAPCPLLETTVNLLSSGQLFPCCGDIQPISLKEHELTFDGIFNHESVRLLRTLWALHEIPLVCQHCLRII